MQPGPRCFFKSGIEETQMCCLFVIDVLYPNYLRKDTFLERFHTSSAIFPHLQPPATPHSLVASDNH